MCGEAPTDTTEWMDNLWHWLKHSATWPENLHPLFEARYLQCPPFKTSHMDQKVSSSLLPVTPPSMPKRAQKYITSLFSSCVFSSRTLSALNDNETWNMKKGQAIIAILKKHFFKTEKTSFSRTSWLVCVCVSVKSYINFSKKLTATWKINDLKFDLNNPAILKIKTIFARMSWLVCVNIKLYINFTKKLTATLKINDLKFDLYNPAISKI